MKSGLTVLVLGSLAAIDVAGATIVEINGTKTPYSAVWGVYSVGWVYNPAQSFELEGFLTKFGPYVTNYYNRTVLFEVYSAPPSNGGTLLRSVGFTPAEDAFSGTAIPKLSLVAGVPVFLGFNNVGSLGVNITDDAGATNLGNKSFFIANDSSYSTDTGFGGRFAQPILILNGTLPASAVPEPATWVAVAFALVWVGRIRRA